MRRVLSVSAAAAFLGLSVLALPGAAATPSAATKKLTAADYRQACSASFTPAAIKQRVEEYKDMNGSEYAAPDVVERESRAAVDADDLKTLTGVSTMTDADLKKVLKDNNGMMQTLVDLPASDLRLKKSSGMRLLQCLMKTRIAQTTSAKIAAALASTPGAKTAGASTAAAPGTAATKTLPSTSAAPAAPSATAKTAPASAAAGAASVSATSKAATSARAAVQTPAATPGATASVANAVTPKATTTGASGWSTPPTGGANCRDAIQRNTDAINRVPQPPNQVARYQYIMAIAADRLAILDAFCKSDAVAYADYTPVKKLYDDTMRTCRQDQSDASKCKPVRTW